MVYIFNKKLPRKDDLVYGEIIKKDDMGLEVKLPDYNDTIGCVSTNETSRMGKKQVKLLNVGLKAVFIVIAVDNVKGYIDLSKHNISKDEIEVFDKKRKNHVILYNFFKYLLMKIKRYETIDFIQNEELEVFLTNTLWEIQKKYDNDDINNLIFDSNKNESILEEINFANVTFTLEEIKSIVDNYISTKLNQSKVSARKNFCMITYKITGLDDIKYATDFNTFECYSDIVKNHDLRIIFDTNFEYNIYIEQKNFSDEDVNNYINIVEAEIKKRAEEKEIMFFYKKND
jgi:translation initiation factor 2 alpha subunit (eIF-2alpha)